MHYLISGLAKSGTTMLFSRLKAALGDDRPLYFEPDTDAQLAAILTAGENSLTKVLVGRVTAKNRGIADFDRHIAIYRDPRDQFISMLLYLFYDFQQNGDLPGFEACFKALERKVGDPEGESTIALYDLIASTVGRAPIAVFNNLHREQRAYFDTFTPYLARYETLLDGDWQALEAFLELDLQADAAVPGEYRRVARSKAYGDWRRWLNREDLAFLNEQWRDNLAWLGYPPGDARVNEPIPYDTSLGYVSQFRPARG